VQENTLKRVYVGDQNGADVKAEFDFCFERKTQRVI
jgi:hypothetical protein